MPEPLLSVGGTSLEAFRSALRLTVAAMDGLAIASAATQARAARLDRKIVVLIWSSFWECGCAPVLKNTALYQLFQGLGRPPALIRCQRDESAGRLATNIAFPVVANLAAL